jgi:phage tail sheath protein FI
MLQQCERLGDRVALLDPPWDAAASDGGADPVQAWRGNFDSAYGALYFPWLMAPDPLGHAVTRAVPACGHVAGMIAATDLAVGVHKAPANANLAWAQDVTVAIDPTTQGALNSAGINAILGASGRPLRVMGARTVSADPNFRFLNVRRLICMIRAALELCARWVVFEPNSPHTRASLTATISRFLDLLFKQGALAGATAASAFQVICNDSNNPEATQVLGQLHVDIGVAPSVPFEFVLLRLGRSADSLDIQERGVLHAGGG